MTRPCARMSLTAQPDSAQARPSRSPIDITHIIGSARPAPDGGRRSISILGRGPGWRQQNARRNFLPGAGSADASTCGSVRPRRCKHLRVRRQFVRPFGQDERYRSMAPPGNGVIHELAAVSPGRRNLSTTRPRRGLPYRSGASSRGQLAGVVEPRRHAVAVDLERRPTVPPSAARRRQRRSPVRAARQVAAADDQGVAHLDGRDGDPLPHPEPRGQARGGDGRRHRRRADQQHVLRGPRPARCARRPSARTTFPWSIEPSGSGCSVSRPPGAATSSFARLPSGATSTQQRRAGAGPRRS